ncbi:unnamed protein product [Brassica napus]|uniref:(rape) hypothetical protein n=1 Tax=Brassica napus TaxID=3708 RepID=A0A816IV15_BRANA|nr:unnamed protein product [Brassica napus]
MSSQVADFHHGSQTLRDFVSAIESSQTCFISSPLDLSFEPLSCSSTSSPSPCMCRQA